MIYYGKKYIRQLYYGSQKIFSVYAGTKNIFLAPIEFVTAKKEISLRIMSLNSARIEFGDGASQEILASIYQTVTHKYSSETEHTISISNGISYLSVDGNEITSLHVSGGYTRLNALWCENNRLRDINIGNLPNLKALYLRDNQLPESTINLILSHLSNGDVRDGTLFLTRNAYPSGQGLIDKQTLKERGWVIETDGD